MRLTVAAAGVGKVYDGTTAGTVNLTTTDRLGSDLVTISSATPTFDTKNAGPGKALCIMCDLRRRCQARVRGNPVARRARGDAKACGSLGRLAS